MTYRMTSDLAPDETWFKSSFSGETGNNCVEVADLRTAGQVGVRDSKDTSARALVFPAESFAAFVTAVREGALGA
jgi:hypothetical protein